jgi:putative transposase
VIPRPGTPQPPRRHLRLATRERSLPRTAVGAHVAPLADGPANASPDDPHDQLLDASLLPSQLLTVEVLRRPVESAQYLSVRYTQRLEDEGAVASVGSRGDSFDNALAEAVHSLYKAELIGRRGPWRTAEQVELATLEWVQWWNERRLHGAIGDIPPAEHEAIYYRQHPESKEVA